MSGGNRRQATPLSPSPSPEPAEGARQNNTGGFKPLSIGGASGLTGQSGQTTVGNVGNSGQQGMSGGSNGEIYGNLAQEQARYTLEERIRVAIDDLMQLATCAAEVHDGDEDIVRLEINKTMESLQGLQNACDSPDLTQMVPEDVMTMIDSGRNPDIHTRTFTNRLNSDNQQMRGQAINFDVSSKYAVCIMITI